MEKEIRRMRQAEGRVGLTAATLPWWAKVLIAQQSGEEISLHSLRHIHHCINCDCAMICQDKACRDFQMFCPECSENSR